MVKIWTHQKLCDRAVRWLSGTKKCNPVFSGIASTSEVPDAIGWTPWSSIVVECKTSKADFYADKKKYIKFRSPDGQFTRRMSNDYWKQKSLDEGWKEEPDSAMGQRRYFMSEPDVITAQMIQENRPDHGLLHVKGKQVRVIIDAPVRKELVDYPSEIRCLKFAFIHFKDNLMRHGFTVDISMATKSHWAGGGDGIELPVQKVNTDATN